MKPDSRTHSALRIWPAGKLTSVALLLGAAAVARAAEIIPSERLVPWKIGATVGVAGGIPIRTSYLNAAAPPYNADTNGITNASVVINNAISAAPSNTIIYLPPGNYRLDSSVNLKSFVTIRGAGMGTTTVRYFGPYGAAFAMEAVIGADWTWSFPSPPSNAVMAGFAKGSSNVLVSSTSQAWLGKLCRLKQLNDPALPVVDTMGYEYMRSQLVRITRIDGNYISFWPPLYWSMQTNLNPLFAVATGIIQSSGVEDLTIDATNSSTTSQLLTMAQSLGCWWKNVRVDYCANWAFGMSSALQCQMTGCWAHKTQGGAVPNHAGLKIDRTSGCLIEDNIFEDIFPNIEVNLGSSGNVFDYNFANQTYWGAAFDGNHNPHNHFNLWEGNVAANFQSDGYFGGASEDTLFRNWFNTEIPYGNGSGIWAIKLCRFSRNATVVGNVLGTSRTNLSYYGIFELGQPNIGNEAWTGFGPPWSSANREGGTNTFDQSGVIVATAVPFFGPTNVTWMIEDRTDGSIIQFTNFVSPTQMNANAPATRTNHSFCLAPGPDGYQEMDTNVIQSSMVKGNIAFPITVQRPGSMWPTNDPNASLLPGETLPSSLLYSNNPTWWGTNRWPAFGPDLNPSVGTIPAQERFLGIQIGVRQSPSAPSNLRIVNQ